MAGRMARIACVDVPVLPLQMLLWRRQDWAGRPVAVVDRDKPQGVLLWVDEVARQGRVLPGMRYAAALSLAPDLRAGVVPEAEIGQGVAALTERLQDFSPRVEPSAAHPGVFWIDVTGILPLYPSFFDWAARIRVALEAVGYRSAVAVGFSRFGTYAAARAACGDPGRSSGIAVFDTADQERRHSEQIRIDRLDFDPKLRVTLRKLGVERLGQFVDLPAKGIRRRLGPDAYELYRLARGAADAVLDAAGPHEPLEREELFEHPEADLERVLAVVELLLAELLQQLVRRDQLLADVQLRLRLDDGGVATEDLTPAEPTRDAAQLLGLIRLRLAGMSLTSGVTELAVAAHGVRRIARQLDLFAAPARDLGAARRALACVRAEFGDAAVVRACLRDGHMPEARFSWELCDDLELPRLDGDAGAVAERPMVRRYYPAAVPLALDAATPAGWQIHPDDGPVEDVVGPHVVSGGWWLREVTRDYYYARARSGRWLWVYFDRRRGRWFLQGEVE